MNFLKKFTEVIYNKGDGNVIAPADSKQNQKKTLLKDVNSKKKTKKKQNSQHGYRMCSLNKLVRKLKQNEESYRLSGETKISTGTHAHFLTFFFIVS